MISLLEYIKENLNDFIITEAFKSDKFRNLFEQAKKEKGMIYMLVNYNHIFCSSLFDFTKGKPIMKDNRLKVFANVEDEYIEKDGNNVKIDELVKLTESMPKQYPFIIFCTKGKLPIDFSKSNTIDDNDNVKKEIALSYIQYKKDMFELGNKFHKEEMKLDLKATKRNK